MLTLRRSIAFIVVAASIAMPAASRAAATAPGSSGEAIARLRAAQPALVTAVAPATGTYGLVRAPAGGVLVADDAGLAPEARALAFLGSYGALFGLPAGDPSRVLRARPAETDPITGTTHVRLDQVHRGVDVYGAQLVVHMRREGITGANGVFVPAIETAATPAIAAARAGRLALRAAEDDRLRVADAALRVYHTGLIRGVPGVARLAWAIDLRARGAWEQVFVDATDGAILNRIEMIHAARERCVYTPRYQASDNEAFRVRKEGDPPTNVPPVDNLYDFSGDVYDMFATAFGRDSYDDQGIKMRTVYEVGTVCPNAYWNGGETHYCPGFDVDDIVAHEWLHAYTQFTHGLVYQYQPGALNESYSDIFGEVVDLLNGVDGPGGSNNDEPAPDGVRWLVGEDLGEVGAALGLRDMWDPERRGMPSKVSSSTYVCGDGDGGGVHTNSSVPNHAFAMLTDGQTFNGHTVEGIGIVKASHIYWQAMANYQTPTSGFREHSDALEAACADLTGVAVRDLLTGSPSATVTSDDCAQIPIAVAATEMRDPPASCGDPLLAPGDPAVCPGSTTLLSEDFADGLDGWTLVSNPFAPEKWPGYSWVARGDLPDGRAGTAAFARNSGARACTASSPQNHAGSFAIESGPIVAPADGRVRLYFDHLVASERYDDGGNVTIDLGGEEGFVPLPADAYAFNGPNGSLRGAHPKSGQQAWTGGDAGLMTGSWGTTVADLSTVVEPGATFRIRFDFAQDCATPAMGWFVDDILIAACPPTPAPALSLGPDYLEPDADGTYTLQWARPAGASGPDHVQEATVTPPLVSSDGESMDGWVASTQGDALGWRTATKPQHSGNAWYAVPHGASLGGASILTLATPVAIPAGSDVTLRFKDWYSNNLSDTGTIEVSADGGGWKPVYKTNTPGRSVAQQASDFATQSLTERTIDLSAYAGRTIALRLRLVHSIPIYVDMGRYGWFVDDFALTHLRWDDLVTTTGTSHVVVGRAAGSYLYRVRSTYTFGDGPAPGDWSDRARATVA